MRLEWEVKDLGRICDFVELFMRELRMLDCDECFSLCFYFDGELCWSRLESRKEYILWMGNWKFLFYD